MPAVFNPFRDVAEHIERAEAFAGILTDGSQAPVTIGVVFDGVAPGALGRECVKPAGQVAFAQRLQFSTPWIHGIGAGPQHEFPLRFGRQAVQLAGPGAEPVCIGIGVFERHMQHRITVAGLLADVIETPVDARALHQLAAGQVEYVAAAADFRLGPVAAVRNALPNSSA